MPELAQQLQYTTAFCSGMSSATFESHLAFCLAGSCGAARNGMEREDELHVITKHDFLNLCSFLNKNQTIRNVELRR